MGTLLTLAILWVVFEAAAYRWLPALSVLRRRARRSTRDHHVAVELLQAGRARQAARERAAAQRLYDEWLVSQGREWVGALTWRELELLVAALVRRDGGRATVSGRAGDRGADVTYFDAAGVFHIAQCKQRGERAGGHDLVHFVGAMTHHGADAGVFVSTSGFTREAQEVAQLHGITLLDAAGLARWARSAPVPAFSPPNA